MAVPVLQGAVVGVRRVTRPLRSLLLGDTDHYFSPYIFGVAQACGRMGIWHSQVSIRVPIGVIAQRVRDVRPDLLWTHMLLWPPEGAPRVESLLSVCAEARRRGAFVLVHDGDVKERTRHPSDISDAVDLALCNHTHDRSAWRVPGIRWPYGAFPQDRLADPVADFACDIAFAGQVSDEAIYADRSRFLGALAATGVRLRIFDGSDGNTMLRTPESAASATTIIGTGRGIPGWTDTRVFQYPGAGAILLHDEADEFLAPGVHFMPYRRGDVASAVEAFRRVASWTPMQREAFRWTSLCYVQDRHSYVARVRQVIAAREMGLP